MKTSILAIALVLVVLALLAILYSLGPTVVERPVVVNRYIQEQVPVYVQPGWWGFYGAPWGSGSTKPWKIGSGLPGMKVPPPPPVGPSPPPPGPAPTPPPPTPEPTPPPA